MSTSSLSIEEGNKQQIDFLKYFKPTDFDSPEVIEEMEFVAQEIKKVLEGVKIDPTKMLTTFQVVEISDKFVKEHKPVWFTKYHQFFSAGIIAGTMININSKQEIK